MSFIPVVWERLSRVKPKKLTAILDALTVFFAGLESAGKTEAPVEARPESETPPVRPLS
jgi:hypothetical protein